jgi:pentatricopeptide repeat protein
MAAPAAASRARRLSSIFSSTTTRAQTPKPAPAPAPARPLKVAAGEAEAKPNAGREANRQNSEGHHAGAQSGQAGLPVHRRVGRIPELPRGALPRLRGGCAPPRILRPPRRRRGNPRLAEALPRGLHRKLRHASHPPLRPRIHAVPRRHDLPRPSPKAQVCYTFDTRLYAYFDARDFVALATEFQQIPVSYPTVIPNVSCYNILIKALCHKPDLSAALDVIPLMEKCGLTPNEISFTTLLNGFYNNNRFDDAEKF